MRGTDENGAKEAAETLALRIRQELQSLHAADGRVLGPAPCPVVKLRDFYRFHIQAHARDRDVLCEALERTQAEVKIPSEIQWIIDLDPIAML